MLENGSNPVFVGNDGFGGGIGILAIIIIAMMFMRGGFFGGNNGCNGNDNTAALIAAMGMNSSNRGYQPQYATQQDVQYTSQFGQLLDGNRDIVDNITRGTAQSVAAVNEVYHNLAETVNDKYSELTRDISGLSLAQAQALANQNQCCCETKMLIAETGNGINAGIAQTRYENALNTAAIQKTITEEAQKNRDMFMRTRMEDIQSENNFLKTQNLLGNVVRYPTQSVYSAGGSPFCNGNSGNCGCNNGCGCNYPFYA